MTQKTETTLDETSTLIIWPQDGKEMVFISGGVIIIGSNHSDTGSQPEHQVEVAEFYIDRWPVTNKEYKQFIDATGHHVPNYEVSWCHTQGYNWNPQTRLYPAEKEHHPVVLVTWEDAMAYAAWAGKRLPTEAEWERVARGFQGRRYPWGHNFKEGCCNSKETGLGQTTPVGYFSPAGDTPEGVIDVIGNVWEWTNTLYRAYPYDANDGRESREALGFRVLRGASWVNDAHAAHALTRLDADFLFYNNVGFRCAASLI